MLINFSNHPSRKWDAKQLEASSFYGAIIDIRFPKIDPEWDEEQIRCLGNQYVKKIIDLAVNRDETVTVHVMGEMTFSQFVTRRLMKAGLRCIASTTERDVEIDKSMKISEFSFVRFRDYI